MPAATSSPTVNSYRRLIEIAGRADDGVLGRGEQVGVLHRDPLVGTCMQLSIGPGDVLYLVLAGNRRGGLIGMEDELEPLLLFRGDGPGLPPNAARDSAASTARPAMCLPLDDRLGSVLGVDAVDDWLGTQAMVVVALTGPAAMRMRSLSRAVEGRSRLDERVAVPRSSPAC